MAAPFEAQGSALLDLDRLGREQGHAIFDGSTAYWPDKPRPMIVVSDAAIKHPSSQSSEALDSPELPQDNCSERAAFAGTPLVEASVA